MCSRPPTKDGRKFACRRCDECIATRRHDWVSRAMAERSMSRETFAVTLTYADDTQYQRDGAAMFRYADIKLFLANLRRAIEYRTGQTAAVRFIAAGEQGDREGRCHWHMLLFSAVDLLSLGTFEAPWGVVTRRQDIISPFGKPPRRRRWSMWPHGLVVVQEPDEDGITYAVTYALKDQFTAEKSEGTMREAKVETFATGMFKMSKRPPIGAPFIDELLVKLRAEGNVLPAVRVSVPDSKMYWAPSGTLRKRLLAGMKAINDECHERHGRPAPQWNSLVASCKDRLGDMEILAHGQEEEDDDFEEIGRSIRKRAAEQAREQRRKTLARTCGSSIPCTKCLNALGVDELQKIGVERYEAPSAANPFAVGYRFAGDETAARLVRAQSDRAAGGVNALCGLNGTAIIRDAFPRSARRDS